MSTMTKKKVIFCNLRNDLPQCRKDPPALYMAYGMGIMMDICKANYLDFDFFDTYVLSDGTKSFLEYYKEIKQIWAK